MSSRSSKFHPPWQLSPVISTKENNAFYLNSTLKRFNLENLEFSFGTMELIFLIFFFSLEQEGWKARNEKSENFISEVVSLQERISTKRIF